MPREPDIVLAVARASWDPKDTGPDGTVMDNAPAVSVKEAEVPPVTAAPAGAAAPTPSRAIVLAKSRTFLNLCLCLLARTRPEWSACSPDRGQTVSVPRSFGTRHEIQFIEFISYDGQKGGLLHGQQ
jgi:hypothetical protein